LTLLYYSLLLYESTGMIKITESVMASRASA